MKAVIFGGTTGMGRAVARKLSERGARIFLLGLSEEELSRSAADLSARNPSRLPVHFAVCDLEKPETFLPALDAADEALGNFDTVVVTAAMFATQEALEADTALARRLLQANGTNTIVFCEEVRKRLLARGGGQLTVFSSVAGERGRKPVGIYGASKAALSHYLEALDHRYHSHGLSVLCVKPGFVKTGMTAGLKPPPFAGEPEEVAVQVVKAMERHKPVLYTPSAWKWVMLAVRNVPRFVMRRVAF